MRRLSRGERSIILATAARDAGKLSRALDLLEVERRVVASLEPVESPEATGLDGLGHLLALLARADAAVLGAGEGLAVLRGAAVKEAHAATGHKDIELVVRNVASGVGGLHNHGLAGSRAVGEGELVARAAPAALVTTVDGSGGETVGELVVDGPGLVVGASVGRTAFAARDSERVPERVVAGIAGTGRGVDGGLVRPRAARLAAVPVAAVRQKSLTKNMHPSVG